jgi:hypothetical protein
MAKTQSKVWVASVLLAASMAATAQPDGIRAACKIFIERSITGQAGFDFGNFSQWTVVDNKDGTWSVGGRYTIGNGARAAYTTCVIRREGGSFKLVSLTRLL